MTVTRDQLLRAALASADDTERLVYADWLEQHGELARAQLIHFQCELARVGKHERRRRELEWELAVVLGELGDRWRDELPALDGVTWVALERGFASTVRVTDPETLHRHADAIAAAAPVTRAELESTREAVHAAPIPWLRVVKILNVMGDQDRVISEARELELATDEYEDVLWLERTGDTPLERLTVRGTRAVGEELAVRLSEATWARQLVTLEVGTAWVDDDTGYNDDPRLRDGGARALTRLTKLEVLDVDRQAIGAPALVRLLTALPALRELSARECGIKKLGSLQKAKGAKLERLDLSRNPFGSAGLGTIVGAPRCEVLQRLELDTCELDSIAVGALTQAPCWQHLRWLDLSQNPLGAAGLRALAEAPHPARLHTLRLADVDLDEAAAGVLGKIPWLGQLAALDLAGNPLRSGALVLRTIEPGALRELVLSSLQLGRTEAAALSRFWPNLVRLDLGNNAITDAGLERFATTKEAGALQELTLRDCKLGDDGLELLARARTPRLRRLDLAGNQIAGPALASLLRAPSMQRLESLDLSRCELDAEAIAAFTTTALPPRLATVDLRGSVLAGAQVGALVDSPTLARVTSLHLTGSRSVFTREDRDRLTARFGASWYREDVG